MPKPKASPPPRTLFSPARIALLLLACFAFQALWHARDKSATYDEGGHLAAGLLLWKTEFSDYDITHPPLIRYWLAAPAAALGPSLPPLPLPRDPAMQSVEKASINDLFVYAAHLIYQNRVPADRLIFSARCAAIALALACGFLIFRWSSRLYGPEGGLLSLALFAFCPNLIAHGSLITTDFPGAASAALFLFALSRLLERPGRPRMILAGAAMGAALLCKFSNVGLLPLFAVLLAALRPKEMPWSETLKTGVGVLLVAWLTVCAGYAFDAVAVAHALSPEEGALLGWGPAAQSFFRHLPMPERMLRGLADVAAHNGRGHGAFLFGEYSLLGWWYYFPLALLVKTPCATLIAGAVWAALFGNALRRFRAADSGLPVSKDEIVLLAGIGLYFGSALASGLNIGIRHVLVVFPLFYVLAGRVGAWAASKGWQKYLAAAAVLLALETAWGAPHYLAFFNRFCGGPAAGTRYLSDSNLDWGQDLKNLGRYLESQGKPEVLLSYFGTAVPQSYGINYQRLPSGWAYPGSRHLNSPEPAKELLAISATNLQGTYFGSHDLYGWLRTRTPVEILGGSIFVYDVTGDLESHERLLGIYLSAGMAEEARRQEERVRRLKAKTS